MTRENLVMKLMEKTKNPVSHADMERIVKGFMEEIINAVANGETVSLIGLGTFEARERAARTGHNPKTGESITIPAKKVPAFKPGTAFKAAVNK